MKSENNHSDEELILKLKNHDDRAMINLYKNYSKGLYLSAFKILRDKEVCEDIVQELFIRIWNSRDNLNITSSIQNYLSASVRYEVYRKLRHLKKYETITSDMIDIVSDMSSSDIIEFKELQGQISYAIDKLPEKCREVYNLSRNELLSHKEISDRLSISTNTVRNHLARALQQLRVGLTHLLFILLSLLFLK